jgi:hypothetical protein
VISDDFESYAPDVPNTPVAPYSFSDVPSNITTHVRGGVGVGGSQALEIQFDMTQAATLNTGMRYPRPATNNTTSNLAKYMLSFDMALVAGGVEGFFSSPKIELFSNNGVNASGFLIDDNLLTPGGGYQHYSYLLSEADEITFGHTQHVDPTVATLDVAFVFLGFPAGATQHQNYLIDNLKIEIAPAPPVDLTLVVNKTTEEVRIRNNSANPVSFDYYLIESAQNALEPAGWNSLDDQNYDFSLAGDFQDDGDVDSNDFNHPTAGFKARFGNNLANNLIGADFLAFQRNFGQAAGPADSWIEAGGSNKSKIGELFLNGATTLNPSQEVSLGAIYDNSVFGANNGDLVFNVSTGGSTALGIGQVSYITSATAVPEPASAVLCLAALTMLARKRRQFTSRKSTRAFLR